MVCLVNLWSVHSSYVCLFHHALVRKRVSSLFFCTVILLEWIVINWSWRVSHLNMFIIRIFPTFLNKKNLFIMWFWQNHPTLNKKNLFMWFWQNHPSSSISLCPLLVMVVKRSKITWKLRQRSPFYTPLKPSKLPLAGCCNSIQLFKLKWYATTKVEFYKLSWALEVCWFQGQSDY